MDRPPPSPERFVSPHVISRYSSISNLSIERRDATEHRNRFVEEGEALSPLSSIDVSSVDNSKEPVPVGGPGDLSVEAMDTSALPVSPAILAVDPCSRAPIVITRALPSYPKRPRTSSASSRGRGSPRSLISRRASSVEALPSQGDLLSLSLITSSMEQLSVSQQEPLGSTPSALPAAQRPTVSHARASQEAIPARGSATLQAPAAPSAAQDAATPPPAGSVSRPETGSARFNARRGSRTGARGAKRPRPLSPHSLPQVNISQLPRETPLGYTNHLAQRHPWARFINPRPTCMLRERLPTVVTTLNTSVYRHLPDTGYLSIRFNKSLFPQVTLRETRPPSEIPFIEVPHLEDSIAFRERSLQVINEVLAGTYVDIDVADHPLTSSTEHPYVTAPPEQNGIRPVLYQIVSTGWGTGVILEVKDFFAIGPDRRDLHCITLDQHCIEILRGGRGFNRSLVSVKDFVWVYGVKPTRQALADPAAVLEQSRIPRTTALDTSSVYFFRASHFAFVSPTDRDEPIYGIVLSLATRRGRVVSARAAFEGCPEAVTITPFLCSFPMEQLSLYEVVSARSRVNVSSAMRFSEPPVSFEARDHLANIVRCFLPMHPEEGILPLSVDRITQAERDWLTDRLHNFTNYQTNKAEARKRLGKICNAACSALAAVNSADDDRRSHRGEATVVIPEWFPMRLRFTLSEMTSEAGWTAGRQAVIWISGASRLIRLKVVDVQAVTRERTLTVVLQAFRWSNDSLTADVDQYGRTVGEDTVIDVCVRLCKSTAAADPIYDLVSRTDILSGLRSTSIASRLIDLIYGSMAQAGGDHQHRRLPAAQPPLPQSFSVSGRPVVLTPDQAEAVRLGTSLLPVVAIQAAFGTGKTLVGALIAALSSVAPDSTVIVTTSTNAAVAQFTETLLSLDDFPRLRVVRHISDTAAAGNLTPTSVDLSKVLKTLGEVLDDQLDETDQTVCARFKACRQLLEDYLEHPEIVPEMSDDDKAEYEIAEQFTSLTLKKMVRILFRSYRPSVLCMTTSSLLNSTTTGGIFKPYISSFRVIIGDEASQIPEPALLAIAVRLQDARHVYIGDVHQLSPHSKCPPDSNPVLHGARGVMTLLLRAPAIPVAPLVTTFRSHPSLIQLPNQLAYNGALISGTRPEARRLLLNIMNFPTAGIPFLFVDLFGESVRAANRSHYNLYEAEAATTFIEQLLSKGLPRTSMCVISFYREQYRLMAARLAPLGVEVTTVDSVQGREKEVVILLSTKTEMSPDTSGFLDDYRRLNVAVTRCRHGQFIFGHAHSLREMPSWGRLLEWAQSINAVVPVSDLPRYLRPPQL